VPWRCLSPGQSTSSNYGANGSPTAEGGTMLVGVLGLFIVLMLGAGLFLERKEF